jgi:GGDEF domain-containing protein
MAHRKGIAIHHFVVILILFWTGLAAASWWWNIIDLNASPNHRYELSLSIGAAVYDPQLPCSLDDLISRADAMMYEQKKMKSIIDALVKSPSNCHIGESRYPELSEYTGFRVKHGMTK